MSVPKFNFVERGVVFMTEILYFLLGLITSAIGGAAVGYLFAKK